MITCLIEHQREKTYIYILKKAFHSLTQIQTHHVYTMVKISLMRLQPA